MGEKKTNVIVLVYGGPSVPHKKSLNNVKIKKKQSFKENVAIQKKRREYHWAFNI